MVCVPAWVSQVLTPEWLTAIGTVAAAIATAAAVVVALFLALYGKHLERWQFHPVLRLGAWVRRPDADKVSRWRRNGDSLIVEGESWYFRLAITNEGNDAAREVQVFLARVERKHGHKTQPVSRFTPMNLKWTNTDDEQTSRDRVTRPVLLADTPDVYCDLVHVNDPSIRSLSGEDLDTVTPGEGVLGLDVQVPTYSKGHLLERGAYIFYLTISASNCDSTHYELEVSYSGKWSGDEKAMFHEFKMAAPTLVKRGALLAKFRSPG